MAIAVRNEGSKVNSNINVTPMVDVMLVLLIIFMVITPMLQNKVQIDMAQVINPESMPDADKDDADVYKRQMLAPAAIDAVKQWKYKPYLLNGEPVEVDTEVLVNFTLSGG